MLHRGRREDAFRWRRRAVRGWTVAVRDPWPVDLREALESAWPLLAAQCDDVARRLPGAAVRHLRGTTLWISPPYTGVRPTAEYHPGADWLAENGRDPGMVRGVEITDIADLAAEIERMPCLLLHELAHAFHHQVLGFDRPDIVAAWERAMAAGTYDRVERRFSRGRPPAYDRHYALATPQEFFAEMSEAWFGQNDYFPYDRAALVALDPETASLVERLWRTDPRRSRQEGRAPAMKARPT
ncbi:MAG: hypothetical protein ACKO5K_16045 [Armatimonadota bacterium]